jgi:fucose 4-O-acetylase-like acetyltransferase
MRRFPSVPHGVTSGWFTGALTRRSDELRGLVEATPPHWNRHVDLLRALAISAVVLGHWLAAIVTYDEGGLGGGNALQVLPWTQPLTWLFQVMPVFFLVGGYANAASLTSHRRRGGDATTWLLVRTGRLLRPTTAFVLALTAAALAARILGADPQLVGSFTWLASIPLWFITTYLAVVVLTPVMHALHHRAGLVVPVVLLGAVAAGDLARLRLGWPYVGEANYLLGWLAIHQVGFSWQDGRLSARPGVALPLGVGGLAALVLLTGVGPYPVSMVAVPGAPVQNTAPPTVALLALAAVQVGLALLVSERSNRWLRRARVWTVVVAVNAVVLTVFLWHMTAVVLAAIALYPNGLLPQAPAGSAAWLLLRLPWLACLTLVLLVLVAVFGRIERRSGPRPHRRATEHDGARPVAARGLKVLTGTGIAVLLAALLGVTLAGPGDHGPAGLPTTALLGYLLGAAALRQVRRTRDRAEATR